MKRILGLDIGTNSIGWAIINQNFEKKKGEILGLGSRIIPMSQDMISDFNKGVLQSSTSMRTAYRGVRRLRERSLNRRKRLIKTLKILGFIDDNFIVNHKTSIAYEVRGDKSVFKFETSYHEMKTLFKIKHKQSISISHDWTIFYLRKKALKEKISKEELAWVILQFNTKRGYFQLRGDDSLDPDSKKYFVSDIVDRVSENEGNRRGIKAFTIELRNEIVGEFSSKVAPDFIGKNIEFVVSEKRLKDGSLKVTLATPGENDWTLRKKKTENEIEVSNKTIGEFIFDKLLLNPKTKIRGKEVHTIDRKYYRNELIKILEKQKEFHSELNDPNIFSKIAHTLYKNNKSHRNNLLKKSISHTIIDDIIYYQRPLKSKKYLISNCKYESYCFKVNNEWVKKPIKVIAKSHPLFQEFRIWGLIHNLKVFQKEKRGNDGILKIDFEITDTVLNEEVKGKVFKYFNTKKEVSQAQFLKLLGLTKVEYKWNYEENIKLKGNEILASLLKVVKGIEKEKETVEIFHDPIKLEKIWHALYSLAGSEEAIAAALQHPSINLTKEAIKQIIEIPAFSKEYGSLSKKAISKLIPLMRCGKYWNQNNIDDQTVQRIENIVNGEVDENITERVRAKTKDLHDITHFQGLQDWLASYVVYGRHSELAEIQIYTNPNDIDVNKLVPQHSLRNPTVEKILRETMLVVRDIWLEYGKPDEIHVEMAREMKLPGKQRYKYTMRRNENRRTNMRAKAMLRELQKNDININPFSIGQLELFKLYEEGVVNSFAEMDDDIKAIRRKDDPSSSELIKYKLWLDQKYISPYTGQPIPLSKLFTPQFEIEHVIPKSKFYDDSFANKIICEKEANQIKDNRTAYQFINEFGGTKLVNGSCILDKDSYESLVMKMFKGKFRKIKNLLSYDVPKSFNSNQLNNTRYISKKLLSLLDPVVRDDQDKGERTRHIIPMVGGITHKLKNDWGLHKIWKKLLAPRFQRMNEITNSKDFYNVSNQQIHLSGNDVELKRLDHRHHALDALIIACTTRQHVQYINSYSNEKIRYDLKKKLFRVSENGLQRIEYDKPWPSITMDAYNQLKEVIVSFKQNTRIINRTTNYYQKYIEKKGEFAKTFVKQKKSHDYWSIRRPMHKDTIHGRRTIREFKEVNISKAIENISLVADRQVKIELKKRLKHFDQNIKALKKDLKINPINIDGHNITRVKLIHYNKNYASKRKVLDESFDRATVVKKVLGGNTKRILLDHLKKYDDNPKEAFSINGLIELNNDANILIKKVTVVEDMGKKFPLGESPISNHKYVESAKGTNMFFIIYRNKESNEHLITKNSTLSFGETIALMKAGLPLVEEKENHNYFTLSPGDLVYCYQDEDRKQLPEKINVGRIYKCVSFTKQQCFFIPIHSSVPILNKQEYSSLNKQEKSLDDIMIKAHCFKLKVNRLGKIIK